ncbi:nicotinate-nucleotide--dimethylbenzimidazole phosphoribosyltransferase [Microvirga sp. 2TAF3]|uniref:nicotinate-nucleotide--dimethylbenzimidazole phosphoribosyltransferase n=1 Tax=Microvirga sp. 2TAF3 TaxID=3233014 RepID=UPI003F9E3F8F
MNAPATSPFDDIRRLITTMPGPDEAAVEAVRLREAQLTKPAGSLGRLEWLNEWVAAWQGKGKPSADRPLVCVFAGSHGVTARGVSAYPSEVNRQMLENFSAGGAAINQICASLGLGFKVFDLAIDMPTADIVEDAAMDEKSCVATMAFGMEAIAGGTDLLAIGELGIGNTTIAAAIYAALYDGSAAHWVGRGSGVDDEGLKRKIAAVEGALERHRDHLKDPLEVLRRLGGREVAAMTGAILAARLQRIPVILDGYVATSAAAILHAIHPATIDHCIAGHLSAEGAHQDVLERLGKIPLLALGMRLGEGTGAALAMGIVKTAVTVHRDMATFGQAGVSERLP